MLNNGTGYLLSGQPDVLADVLHNKPDNLKSA